MNGCCSFKCCFIFFNAIFLASGVALIVIGALQYPAYSQISTLVGMGLSKLVITVIVMGAIITVVSIIGHFGAFFNNSHMMTCFICILTLIILLEILTGVFFYVFHGRIVQMTISMSIKMKSALKLKHGHSIDGIQEKFQCCGASSYHDWSLVGVNVPASCCQQKDCEQNKDNIYKKGCIGALKLFLVKNLVWAGGICIVLGITEIFGVIIGICLCLNIKRKNYENIN